MARRPPKYIIIYICGVPLTINTKISVISLSATSEHATQQQKLRYSQNHNGC